MATITLAAAYQLARTAGLPHDAAVTAAAIAKAESGLRTDARGDTGITTGTWGPSIGLWQVRSLKAETGTGRTRDANRLADPGFNARSMAAISSRGTNFAPWSVYKSGAYRQHLADAKAAAGTGTLTAPTIVRGSTAIPDIPDPFGLGEGIAGQAGDVAEAVRNGLLLAAAVGLGVVLVAVGAHRVVSR